MLALVLGSVLGVLGLAYVLAPLLRGAVDQPAEGYAPDLPPESSALDALREIEFDRETGKLSDEDYTTLKATYTPKALAELRLQDATVAVASHERATEADAAELLIQRVKARGGSGISCANCGPRPEEDAVFCSDWGGSLSPPPVR